MQEQGAWCHTLPCFHNHGSPWRSALRCQRSTLVPTLRQHYVHQQYYVMYYMDSVGQLMELPSVHGKLHFIIVVERILYCHHILCAL